MLNGIKVRNNVWFKIDLKISSIYFSSHWKRIKSHIEREKIKLIKTNLRLVFFRTSLKIS